MCPEHVGRCSIFCSTFCLLEWYEKTKTLPTARDIDQLLKSATSAWEVGTPGDGTLEKMNLLIWYFDWCLPVVAGNQYWGTNRRFYHYPTGKVKIKDKDRVLVPVATEAFGLLVLENCREKWINMFQFKEQHGPKATIPTKGKEAEPFQGRWTNSKVGQVEFGGWHADAYKCYEGLKILLRDFRKHQQEKKEMECFKYAKSLLRNEHNITQQSAEMTKEKRSAKKRKRSTTPTTAKKLTRDEDE